MYTHVSDADLLDLSVRTKSLLAQAQALLADQQIPVSAWGYPVEVLTHLNDEMNVELDRRGLLADVPNP